MSDELGFSSKEQFWGSLNLVSLREPVRPTLYLSKEALETPLPEEGWLHKIREFLTRSGRWEGHSIDSVEVFVAIPAPGVSVQNPVPSVVGIDEPVFTSLGFGVEGVTDGVVKYTTGVCESLNLDSQCNSHLCITDAPQPVKSRKPYDVDQSASKGACYDTYCDSNVCKKNGCISQNCAEQTCGEQFCNKHLCSSHTGVFSFSDELETHWGHPFVKELGRYFGVDMQEDLAVAVEHYVGRNMFDESAR